MEDLIIGRERVSGSSLTLHYFKGQEYCFPKKRKEN